MDELKKIITQLRELTPEKMEQEILAIVRSHEPELLDLNLDQLSKGQRADGSTIGPSYSPTTIQYKKGKNQPSDRVTLFDEGNFYRGFFADTDKFPIEIDSKDFKTPLLDEKYGPSLFGLNAANTETFAENIRPEIEDIIIKAMEL